MERIRLEGKSSDAKQLDWGEIDWNELDMEGSDSDSDNIDWGEITWKKVDLNDPVDFLNVNWSDLDKKDYKDLKRFNKIKTLQLGTNAKKETIEGKGSSETIIGGLGNDIVDGKAGNDILLGASTEEGGGRKEKDILTGGKGKNTFVLGSDSGILYDDGKKGSGKKDYATITDFDPKSDKLQLHGASSDYHYKDNEENGEIYYDSNDNGKFDRKDELIGKCDELTEKDFEKALDNAIYKSPFVDDPGNI